MQIWSVEYGVLLWLYFLFLDLFSVLGFGFTTQFVNSKMRSDVIYNRYLVASFPIHALIYHGILTKDTYTSAHSVFRFGHFLTVQPFGPPDPVEVWVCDGE